MVVYVRFLRDVACQKLLNSANVSRSYSQNKTGTVFFETRCRIPPPQKNSVMYHGYADYLVKLENKTTGKCD